MRFTPTRKSDPMASCSKVRAAQSSLGLADSPYMCRHHPQVFPACRKPSLASFSSNVQRALHGRRLNSNSNACQLASNTESLSAPGWRAQPALTPPAPLRSASQKRRAGARRPLGAPHARPRRARRRPHSPLRGAASPRGRVAAAATALRAGAARPPPPGTLPAGPAGRASQVAPAAPSISEQRV